MKLLYVYLILVPCFISASDDCSLLPFKLGQQQFDDTIISWHTYMITTLVKKADELKTDSDIANMFRRIAPIPLNDLTNNENILKKAQQYYAAIQQDKLVIDTFQAAQQAVQDNEEKDRRNEKWAAFRDAFKNQLTELRRKELPNHQDAIPYSSGVLERNKDLKLTCDEQDAYVAIIITLHTGTENSILIDPTLLLK